MAALTQERNTAKREGHRFAFGIAAAAVIYEGALVALNAAGYAVPASGAAAEKVVGIAQETVDNTGGLDGADTVDVEAGVHRLLNSAGADEVTRADIGKSAFAVDDQTVAKTDNGALRSFAGAIVDVDADGVWIELSGSASASFSKLVELEARIADLEAA